MKKLKNNTKKDTIALNKEATKSLTIIEKEDKSLNFDVKGFTTIEMLGIFETFKNKLLQS